MSNIGKELREKNLAKFENNDQPKPEVNPISISPSSRIHDTAAKQGIANGFGHASVKDSPFTNDYFNSKLLGFDLGPVLTAQNESKGYISAFNPNIDFEKLRADNQSAVTKMGSLVTQFLGKTALGTVGNIVGGIYGMGEAAFTDKELSESLFDNALYRTFDEASESWEAKNTIFVNSKDGLGFNFKTAKEINDAFSFIAGMASSEILMQTAGNAMGGAGLATLPTRLMRYSKQVGKIMKSLDNAEDVQKLAKQLGMTVDEMSRVKRNMDLIDKTSKTLTNFARRGITTTGYEASLEARGAKDQLMADMTEDMEYYLKNSGMSDADKDTYRAEKMKLIEEAANSAGLLTFGLNTAVLGASNMIQFPSIFGSSFVKSKSLGSIVRKGLGEVGKQEGKKAAIKNAVGWTGRILKNPATEFMEETLQGVSSKYAQNYHELMLGDRSQGGVLTPHANSVTDSIYKAITDTYGTKEGLHEGIIGAIVGAIGLPGLKKHGKGRKLTWHGGIPGSIKDNKVRNQDIESAINSINSMKMSDVVNYNKDNAIRAALDTQKEDAAILAGNKVEFDSVKDNKTFRYTIDRLEKGMENFIDEDIAEMEKLAGNIEDYRKTFGKSENFTREDAAEEIKAFKEKVDIYKNAYKMVHKRFNENLMRQDSRTKKLTDTLTYAIATEKVYGDRQNKIINTILENTNNEFTQQEVKDFVATSGKIARHQKSIDDWTSKYVNQKESEKEDKLEQDEIREREALKDSVPDNMRHLLDLRGEVLENAIQELRNDEAVSQKALDKAIAVKTKLDKQTKFQEKKSAKVRAQQSSMKDFVAQLNERITDDISDAMKNISKPVEKVTLSEVENYISAKKRIQDSLNKKYKTVTTFERDSLEHENAEELMQELAEITDRYVTATNVAGYLYGFKDNPGMAYFKIGAAQFEADRHNALKLSTYLDILMMSNDFSEEFTSLLDELKDVVTSLKEEFPEVSMFMTDEQREKNQKLMEELDNKLDVYTKAMGTTEDLNTQRKEATEETVNETEDEIKEDDPTLGFEADFSGVKSKKNTDANEDGPKTDDEVIKFKLETDKKHNRFTIRQNSSFVKTNPDFIPNIKNGVFKNNTAVTANMEPQSNWLPENNTYLAEVLKTHDGVDKTESYLAGLEKIKKDPAEVNMKDPANMDPDVYTFVRFVPTKLNFFNKELNPADRYDFEIKEGEDSYYSQWLFTADDILVKEDNVEQRKKDHIDALNKLTEDKEEKIKKANGNRREIQKIEALDRYQRQKLEGIYKASDNSDYSNFSFRQELVANAFNNNKNELKLKIHNVDLGDIESPGVLGNGKAVQEHKLDTLFDIDSLKAEDFYFTNQNGEYVRFDGLNTANSDNHEFKNLKKSNTTAEVFIGRRNVAGKLVPVDINERMLDSKHIGIIMNVLDDFYNTVDKGTFVVKNSGIDFLDGKSLEGFLEFFMRRKANPGTDIVALKNAFTIKPEGDEYHVMFYVGGTDSLKIRNAEDLKKDKIREELVEKLAYNRFSIHRGTLVETTKHEDGTKTSKLHKDVLKYYVDNKIINHSFDVDANFDKIYDAGYNRGLVISRNNTRDTTYKKDSHNYGEDVRELRKSLSYTGKNSKYEGNVKAINQSIMNGVMRSVNIQSKKLGSAPQGEQLAEILVTAIENVFEDRIDKVMKVANRYPDKYNPEGNHMEDFEFRYTDTAESRKDSEIDKYLRLLYMLRKNLYRNRQFLDTLEAESQLWGSKQALIQAFQDPNNVVNININEFVGKVSREKNEPTLHIKSEDQFNTLMELVRAMDKITKHERFMHINYTEDFSSSKYGPQVRQYKDQSGLSDKDNRNSSYYKTRLKSVKITGNPQFKDGKIVNGSVYLNVQDWGDLRDKKGNFIKNPDGTIKQGVKNNQLVLLHDSNEPRPNQNIIISLGLPFIDNNLQFKTKDGKSELKEALKHVVERANQRDINSKRAATKIKDEMGKEVFDDEYSKAKASKNVDENDYTWEEEEEDNAEGGDVIVKPNAGATQDPSEIFTLQSFAKDMENNSVKPQPQSAEPVVDTDDSFNPVAEFDHLLNTDMKQRQLAYNIQDTYRSFKDAGGRLSEDFKAKTKESYVSKGIKTPYHLLLIHNILKERGFIKDKVEITTFAEYVYDEEICDLK